MREVRAQEEPRKKLGICVEGSGPCFSPSAKRAGPSVSHPSIQLSIHSINGSCTTIVARAVG